LELAYQESIQKSDLVLKDEDARRLRLRILLLEDENDQLHEQLAFEDDRVVALEQDRAGLQKLLEEAKADLRRRDGEVRTQARELNNMRVRVR
jgi:c-di-GMP-related signal transduction protein